MRARVFKFFIHLESGQVFCGAENQDAEIYFYHLFSIFLFSISHSNLIHRNICVKDFSGTAVPRILKIVTNVGYDLLYCEKENQHAALIIPFICPIFFLSNKTFHHRILNSYYSQSSNFVYTLRGAKYIVGQKTKILWLNFAFFFHFSISHSNAILREICVNDFSGTTVPRILKFGTIVGYDLLYCVKENQHAAAYHSTYLSIFFSLQANFLLQIS